MIGIASIFGFALGVGLGLAWVVRAHHLDYAELEASLAAVRDELEDARYERSALATPAWPPWGPGGEFPH